VTLDPRLLDLLVCPACHGEIRPVVQPEGLECLGCRRVYPVRDGIPVMLVDEATSRPESDPGSGSRPAAGS
jgi:hypothetical protein